MGITLMTVLFAEFRASRTRLYNFYEHNYHVGTTIGCPQSSEMYHFAVCYSRMPNGHPYKRQFYVVL